MVRVNRVAVVVTDYTALLELQYFFTTALRCDYTIEFAMLHEGRWYREYKVDGWFDANELARKMQRPINTDRAAFVDIKLIPDSVQACAKITHV